MYDIVFLHIIDSYIQINANAGKLCISTNILRDYVDRYVQGFLREYPLKQKRAHLNLKRAPKDFRNFPMQELSPSRLKDTLIEGGLATTAPI